LDEIAEFMIWLQTPHKNVKVSSIKPMSQRLKKQIPGSHNINKNQDYDAKIFKVKAPKNVLKLYLRRKSPY
jgi:hypothetical protein